MARYHRRYRRKRQNTLWQPERVNRTWSSFNSSSRTHGLLQVIHPEMQFPAEGGSGIQPFANQYTLERIRGDFLHTVDDASDAILYMNIAAWKVNRHLADEISAQSAQADKDKFMPDLFDTGDGEDYPLYINCICGASDASPTSNIHMIDNKSRRRFDPGDALVLSTTFQRAFGTTLSNIYVALNLRILWKLIT